MDMKKLLMILAFTLPLMAQEAEAKESVGKKVVRTIQDVEWSKSKSAHQRDHDKKGGMKRGDMKRGDMNRRMAMAKRKKMQKKRAIRSAVRILVVGGLAYYIGYHQGEKHFKGGMKRKPYMGDRK
jgi:hypothetical protein